jgi:hypothetical protein
MSLLGFCGDVNRATRFVLSTSSAALLIQPYSRFNCQPKKGIGSVSGNNYINFSLPDAVNNAASYAHPFGYMYQGRKNRYIYVAAFFRVIKAGPEQPYPGLMIRLADRTNQYVFFGVRYSHIPP